MNFQRDMRLYFQVGRSTICAIVRFPMYTMIEFIIPNNIQSFLSDVCHEHEEPEVEVLTAM